MAECSRANERIILNYENGFIYSIGNEKNRKQGDIFDDNIGN